MPQATTDPNQEHVEHVENSGTGQSDHHSAPGIQLIDYDGESIQARNFVTFDEVRPLIQAHTSSWIHVIGPPDPVLLKAIGKAFDLHRLTLDDIADTEQRAKLEIFENYVYLVIKQLTYDTGLQRIRSEQVNMIFGDRFVVSFKDRSGELFEPIMRRLEKGTGRHGSGGSGFIAYAVFDEVSHHHYSQLRAIGRDIGQLEERILDDPTPDTLKRIHALKKEILFMRRQLWPLREILSHLTRDKPPQLQGVIDAYFADVHDRIKYILEGIDAYRSLLSNMQDLYMSMVNNRMNEVMKVLTIIATIFIPLTFIAGVYGMNFKFMPELDLRYGYFGVLGVMAVVAAGLVVYCKKKKWF